jgi:hypothetical protein
MRLNKTPKTFVVDQNPFLQFDIVDVIASNLSGEISALLKRINTAVFSELISANPTLLNRYC